MIHRFLVERLVLVRVASLSSFTVSVAATVNTSGEDPADVRLRGSEFAGAETDRPRKGGKAKRDYVGRPIQEEQERVEYIVTVEGTCPR